MEGLSLTRFEFLDEQIGVEFVLEQHDGPDFSDFVVNRGGDVSTYRVYGTDGDYRLYAK